MLTAARASGPKTRKAGTATVPTPAIFFNSSDTGNSAQRGSAQYFGPVPRIVGTHWLRWEATEAGNG